MATDPPSVVFRADADNRIGTGHVMRCLALAQAWQVQPAVSRSQSRRPNDSAERRESENRRPASVFLSSGTTHVLAPRIIAEGSQFRVLEAPAGTQHDAQETIALASELGAKWVVVDGYHFGADFQSSLKGAGLKVLAIDDYGHAGHYYCDLLLNQNISADPEWYARREAYTSLLLGTRYALLRTEFLRWREWQRDVAEHPNKVLVTLGGADPDNVTLLVLRALMLLGKPDLQVRVLVGISNPHRKQLTREIASAGFRIELLDSASDMPELMAWADVAVTAAGSTCWELLFMQLPSLMISIAENQRPGAHRLGELGLAVNLDWSPALEPAKIAAAADLVLSDAKRRISMAQRGRKLVDGNGAGRVLAAMRYDPLQLRSATPADCELLWRWANDPEVRRHAFHSDPISPDSHLKWLTCKLKDPGCRILIALDQRNAEVGQIRFDEVRPGEILVDVSVAPDRRGEGFGRRIIEHGVEAMFASRSYELVHALVKVENTSSIHAFENAGFENLGTETTEGYAVLHFLRRRIANS